jgi:hypothetical protein
MTRAFADQSAGKRGRSGKDRKKEAQKDERTSAAMILVSIPPVPSEVPRVAVLTRSSVRP